MPDEPRGLKIARARIDRERKERTGDLDLGRLDLQSWPEELWELEHLTGLNLGNGWDEKGQWRHAKSFFATNRASAREARWASFPNLRHLRINGMAWTEPGSLHELASLQSLECRGGALTTLDPLEGLSSLQSLDCSHNRLTTLKPLARLVSLQSLYCSGNPLATLEPLTGLTFLRFLNCVSNGLTTLTGLEGLSSLQSVNCFANRLTTLEPLAGLPALRELLCWENPLERLPEKLVRRESLQKLVLPETPFDGIPAEALSQDFSDNCLERLRAHFRER